LKFGKKLLEISNIVTIDKKNYGSYGEEMADLLVLARSSSIYLPKFSFQKRFYIYSPCCF